MVPLRRGPRGGSGEQNSPVALPFAARHARPGVTAVRFSKTFCKVQVVHNPRASWPGLSRPSTPRGSAPLRLSPREAPTSPPPKPPSPFILLYIRPDRAKPSPAKLLFLTRADRGAWV